LAFGWSPSPWWFNAVEYSTYSVNYAMNYSPIVLRHLVPIRLALVALAVLGVLGTWTGFWKPSVFISLFFFACFAGIALLTFWARWQRDRLIREAPLPQFLKRKLRETYPSFSSKDCELVERGLRQYFMACNRSSGKFVAMPSKAVDAMWHEFILHTKAYEAWCALTLGRFLHHTPAEALGRKADRNDGLRRAWFWACKDESINPRKPSRLPLLFALDAKLAIAGGFSYLPNCHDINRKSDHNGSDGASYCGTSFSDGSAAGEGDNFGGAEGSSGDGGDGGGDGGGCGGGD
jgi:hypothetical protein